jgi:hypothetical protein
MRNIVLFVSLLVMLPQLYAWDLFGPNDYEECAEEAAIEAKSKKALSVLLSSCDSKFPARRKTGGGYNYCNYIDVPTNNSTHTQVCIDVDSARVSKSDHTRILEKNALIRSESAASKAIESQRRANLKESLRLISWNLDCQSLLGAENPCNLRGFSADVANDSDSPVSGLGVAIAITSREVPCSDPLDENLAFSVSIPPKKQVSFYFDFSNLGYSSSLRARTGVLNLLRADQVGGCMKITSAM